MTRDAGPRWAAPMIAAGLLAAWEVSGRMGWIPAAFFPAPSLVLSTLGRMAASGELTRDLGVTLARMMVALVWGGGAGLVVGLLLGYSPRLRTVVDPFIAALHPVPRMALLPVILLLFGIGFFAKALVVSVATFFPMAINSMAGVRQLDPDYFDVARLYGASRWRIFWRLALPGSLPMILAGARLAINRALGATIGLELITAQDGLGSMLFFAWQTYRTEELYGTVLVVALLGYGFRAIVNAVTHKLVPWQVNQLAR